MTRKLSAPRAAGFRRRIAPDFRLGLIRWTWIAFAFQFGSSAWAHFVPPERLHPVAAAYREMNFLLNLNPILWEEVAADAQAIMDGLAKVESEEGEEYLEEANLIFAKFAESDGAPISRAERHSAATKVFELCTMAVAGTIVGNLQEANGALEDYQTSHSAFDEARQIWASFEHELKATDRAAFVELGMAWLEMAGALGSPGVLGVGAMASDPETFRAEASKVIEYVEANFGDGYQALAGRKFMPLPAKSSTFDATAAVSAKLPPRGDMNKQLPRPRQVLNMTERGVDEGDTTLIALGDMAFDSPYIFGEPARSLGLSCNSCHNKSITNPNFFIPGLSSPKGSFDVSNNFFSQHANNGHFDPVDIPDLRGIRFTAPYGRNGRFPSLSEFTRNAIVNEFNGPEPDPIVVDAIVAYMNEFDFLPNPLLNADGTLSGEASASAKRGEEIFNRPFEGLAGSSCATCHIPSANFVDHKRHDVGTAAGSGEYSRDRALDTPTLLSAKYSPPYFHDGSAPTLRAVSEYFNDHFGLGLSEREVADLTSYQEAVGDGLEAYEDTMHTLEAEMEEFRFFLSSYEHLKLRGKRNLIGILLQTVGLEIQAHKWDVQDEQYLPVLNDLANLMQDAYDANELGEEDAVDALVRDYLRLYEQNVDYLK